MKKTLSLGVLMLSVGLLVGCSPKTPAPTNSSNNSATEVAENKSTTPDSKSAGKDLCLLLSADAVSEIMGYTVTVDKKTLPQTDTITGCSYESTDTDKGYGITIIASYDNAQQTALSQYQLAVDYLKQDLDTSVTQVTVLSGVGEEATIADSGFMGTLYATNKNVWLTESYAADQGETRTDILKKVAAKAFEVL